MTTPHSQQEVFEALYAQAVYLWGEEDASRQREALQRLAEQMLIMQRAPLAPDLEPRFM